MQLHEQYRPKKWADVIAQKRILRRIERLRSRGLGGRAYWISGPTGDSYWSLVAQGDRILALNDTGRLRLIRANPEAFEVIDEIAVADDQTWASLAVAGRDVVVREQHGIAAFRWE